MRFNKDRALIFLVSVLVFSLSGSLWAGLAEEDLNLNNLNLLNSQESAELITLGVKERIIDVEEAFNMMFINFSNDAFANILGSMNDVELRNEFFKRLAKEDRVKAARVMKLMMASSPKAATGILSEMDPRENEYIMNLLEEFDLKSFAIMMEDAEKVRAEKRNDESMHLAQRIVE